MYGFVKEKPRDNNYAFPDLSRKDQKLSSSMFNKMFKMVSSQCFSQPLTVTDIRKLITREISGQTKQTQEAVARAEGYLPNCYINLKIRSFSTKLVSYILHKITSNSDKFTQLICKLKRFIFMVSNHNELSKHLLGINYYPFHAKLTYKQWWLLTRGGGPGQDTENGLPCATQRNTQHVVATRTTGPHEV